MSSLSTNDYAAAVLCIAWCWTAPFALAQQPALVPTAVPMPGEASSAPESGSIEEAVDALVADALQANLELDGASAGVAERLAALDQARARYLPSLDFSARYSRANGGRAIDFPVGD